MHAHAAPQHAADLAAGGVARVQHAAHAVRGLAAERRAAVGVAIEGRPPLHQLGDVARPIGHERLDGLRIAQAVARGDRVPCVQLRRVVGPHGRGDAALRVTGVALARMRLAEDGHLADFRQRERGALPCHAAADHQEVGEKTHDAILSTCRALAYDDRRRALRIKGRRGHRVAHVGDLGGRRAAGRPPVPPGRARRRRQAVRGLQPADLAPPRPDDPAGHSRRPHPHPRRRAPQDAGLGVPDLRRADPRRRRSRQHGGGRGRRRGGRHGGLCRGQLSPRHRAGAGADDAIGAGGLRHRRQGGRQPRAGQEPDRRVSPARARAGRPARPAHAAAPGVPLRACTRWSSTG